MLDVSSEVVLYNLLLSPAFVLLMEMITVSVCRITARSPRPRM